MVYEDFVSGILQGSKRNKAKLITKTTFGRKNFTKPQQLFFQVLQWKPLAVWKPTRNIGFCAKITIQKLSNVSKYLKKLYG